MGLPDIRKAHLFGGGHAGGRSPRSGKRVGLLVHHDDAVREVAYDRQSVVDKLDKGLDEGPRTWMDGRQHSKMTGRSSSSDGERHPLAGD